MVSIIIPTLNRIEKLKNCTQSIINNDYTDKELIIIDNGSTDGTREYLESLDTPRLKLILNPENLGLAKARNQGIVASKGNYILFVDDDNILDIHLIKNLLAFFQDVPEAGIVSPKTYYQDHPTKIWFYGANINLFTSKAKFTHANSIDRTDNINHNLEINCVHNCFMIKREVFEKAGLFDEQLFVSYTEFDLCMRVLEYYRIYLVGNAKCFHDRLLSDDTKSLENYGFTNYNRVYYLIRNRGIIIKRHASTLQTIIFTILCYPLFFIYYGIIFIKHKRLDYFSVHVKGFVSGLIYILSNRLKKLE